MELYYSVFLFDFLPTWSSWTFEISTKTFAAGLSTPTERNIVAPSFVTWISFPWPDETRILSIPFGPNVVLTKSPIAIAPTNDDRRAVSALSCSAPNGRKRNGTSLNSGTFDRT